MKIGTVDLAPPFALAPMAGMTDTAFRRLVKRQGGCGLVVTEMVSSEGLVRGIDRTLEYAEYTEEERPVSIQIFGGDPEKMADAAQIVEGMGADIVDVNMGCPVPKIAKHNAGCSLMREPAHAAERRSRAMAKAVKIPVTVKMRAGWNDARDQRAGAGAAGARTPAPRRSRFTAGPRRSRYIGCVGLGPDRPRRRRRRRFRCSAAATASSPAQIVERLRDAASAACSSAAARCAIRGSSQQAADARGRARAARDVTLERARPVPARLHRPAAERAACDEADGFRHVAPGAAAPPTRRAPARGHERWVINKLRALNSWYTKGLDNGSHLRVTVNAAESVPQLRDDHRGVLSSVGDRKPDASASAAS